MGLEEFLLIIGVCILTGYVCAHTGDIFPNKKVKPVVIQSDVKELVDILREWKEQDRLK